MSGQKLLTAKIKVIGIVSFLPLAVGILAGRVAVVGISAAEIVDIVGPTMWDHQVEQGQGNLC